MLQIWIIGTANLCYRYYKRELQKIQSWFTGTADLSYRYFKHEVQTPWIWNTDTADLGYWYFKCELQVLWIRGDYRDYSPVLMLSWLCLPGDCSSCWLCVSWFMPQAPTGACNKQSLACFNPHAINSHLHVSHRMQQTVACMFHNACKIQDFQASLCEPHAVKVCYSQCGLQSFSRRKNPAEHLTLV